MSIEAVIYLADILPGIGSAMLSLASVIFTITCCICGGVFARSIGDEEIKQAKIFAKTYLFKNLKWFILAILIGLAIPSERTIYMMLGANYLKNSQLPTKVELLLNQKIDEYIAKDQLTLKETK